MGRRGTSAYINLTKFAVIALMVISKVSSQKIVFHVKDENLDDPSLIQTEIEEGSKSKKTKKSKKRKSQNMKIDLFRITKYLRNKAIDSRAADLLSCNMRLIAQNHKYQGTNQIILDLISELKTATKNAPEAQMLPQCAPTSRERKTLKNIFGRKFSIKKFSASRDKLDTIIYLIQYLGSARKVFVYSAIHTLHLMSNLLEVDLDPDFYWIMDRIYRKQTLRYNFDDFFQSQILVNEASKCDYHKEFRNLTGFRYDSKRLIVGSRRSRNPKKVNGGGGRRERLGAEIDLKWSSIDSEEVSLNKKHPKELKEITKRSKKALRDTYWHLNYPVFPTSSRSRGASDSIRYCEKCSITEIQSLCNHIISLFTLHPEFREVPSKEFLITKKTKIWKKRAKNEKEKVLASREEYLMLAEQMARRGDPEAAIEVAQEFHYGNDDAGVAVDERRAMRFYQQAAGRNAFAHALYGIMKMNCKFFVRFKLRIKFD